jgi:hypothetical protein
MFEFWKSWMDAAEFGLEAQSVIGMRLIKIASGGPTGAAEWAGMMTEKFVAAAAAQNAGAIALASGKSMKRPQNSRLSRSGAGYAPITIDFRFGESKAIRMYDGRCRVLS